MENSDNQNEEVDALCRECGQAFKTYVDRLLPEEKQAGEKTKAECPVCGCRNFYVKNPEDEYDISSFQCRDGEVVPSEDDEDSGAPEISEATETFCDKCSWHGAFSTLRRPV